MANIDNANGFQPVKQQTGGEARLAEYSIASAYDAALGKGDPVVMTGLGTNIAKAPPAAINSVGVFAGVRYTDVQGNPVYSEHWPSDTVTEGGIDAVALVWQDPGIVYRVQCDVLAVEDVGLLADWDAGVPNAATRLSGAELVASAGAATGASMRILRLSDIPDNDYGDHAKADVVFASHAHVTGIAGAGGV